MRDKIEKKNKKKIKHKKKNQKNKDQIGYNN